MNGDRPFRRTSGPITIEVEPRGRNQFGEKKYVGTVRDRERVRWRGHFAIGKWPREPSETTIAGLVLARASEKTDGEADADAEVDRHGLYILR